MKRATLVILFLFSLGTIALAETLRVPTEFPTIQGAIDAARAGDTVLVAPGEYRVDGPIDFNAGRRDGEPVKNLTLRSEGGRDLTTIRLATAPGDPEAAGAVLFENGESSDSLLEGFTITGSPFAAGLRIRKDSSPRIESSILADSQVGVHIGDSAAPTLTDCLITRSQFAGLFCEGAATPTVSHCSVTGSNGFGGSAGVACRDESAPILIRCDISGNSVRGDGRSRGSGVECSGQSRPVLRSSTISGNLGIGIYCGGDSQTELTNCVISANRARTMFGGGLFCQEGAGATLTNCVISDHSGRAGVILQGGSAVFRNCIIWKNDGGAFDLSGGASPTVVSSCVEGQDLFPGAGNINDDPLFALAGVFDFDRFDANGLPDFVVEPPDYALRPESPCIDAASADGAPDDDARGQARPCGPAHDMGAFETCQGEGPRFRRGNADARGNVDLTDGIFILNYLFLGGSDPPCLDAADTNDDGSLEITDAVRIFNFLFTGGPPPDPPGPDICGLDPVADDLGCREFPLCP